MTFRKISLFTRRVAPAHLILDHLSVDGTALEPLEEAKRALSQRVSHAH